MFFANSNTLVLSLFSNKSKYIMKTLSVLLDVVIYNKRYAMHTLTFYSKTEEENEYEKST